MSYLSNLTNSHKNALEWFISNTGKEVPWTGTLADGTFLFTKAKGIYKPKNCEYALSIRHAPNSRYDDKDPIFYPDGSWSYSYREEEEKNNSTKTLFTNRALAACMRDEIPVGVALKISEKPKIRYRILGLAHVTKLKDGMVQLSSYQPGRQIQSECEYGPLFSEMQNLIEPDFQPNSNKDAREKILRQIVQRQGQKKFRDTLMNVYKCTCAITGCKIKSVLEAAHITPYLGPHTNHISNGLLLRADIHTLWDLGLIAIDPETMLIQVNKILNGSEYERYQNQKLQINLELNNQPSKTALKQQFDIWSTDK
jgi:putative restriction endonuclease